MADTFRFGRRVAMPSTRQIKHDLLMLSAADKVKALEEELKAAGGEPVPAAAVVKPAV